ncbi:S9 family peptidase [Algoriphagus zhangzhouensis]|uniref:Dipeptidyl-peptidase-4 n=1 Tax=Algoriphagus zhangzhouensis TaxID=1073327 RepID=A0A1M7ZDS9_9BACT|nr:DPP IV N-terminal domain-containing protein [Algoriphagus zhangzhouensis]TDY45898.1 dipeptidyl-peptidase-4 [Algoriphagus zhangzhouensis]SHO63065.1 dipeptidyl-peptidase-4 [Algoriphagus zhangzhouensis]
MKNTRFLIQLVLVCFWAIVSQSSFAQSFKWAPDGESFYQSNKSGIVQQNIMDESETLVIPAELLTPAGESPLAVRDFTFSEDGKKVLIYTNTKRVWRLDTQGDYWVLDLNSKKLQQVGKGLPESSLRFAKLSPDAEKVAYVSEFNLYVEDLNSGEITALTTDGTRKLINGTFDWAYEEEFACRDGFQWSPDGKRISFWQLDAEKIKDYDMINFTDSVYSEVIPVEYPTVGESPSPARIGVIELANQNLTWLAIPGDPQQHYLPRMEWNSDDFLLVQQLNRKQNHSKIFGVDVVDNAVELISEEQDEAWIDVLSTWENVYSLTYRHEFKWLNDNKEFLWLSDKDGWRHLYRIGLDGKETLITKGDFDVMNLVHFDEKKNVVYFHATPENATQKYLFRTKLDGKGEVERVSPANQVGTHNYTISPSGTLAMHQFQSHTVKPMVEWISLPKHQPLDKEKGIDANMASNQVDSNVEFFKVTLADGTEMDGWMVKPSNFDPKQIYPVVFFVYTEPWGANVKDTYGVGRNRLYTGDMAQDGYIYISLDNRGTPAPKGRAWRKSIYRKIGRLNISDQAEAAKQIVAWDFVDPERVGVWGWSGGGSATLNLMFQYPEIYKTGISIAAVANQMTYDNIYQERYMGLPQENPEDFIAGSPITHAKNLEGNLLYIHGTGDDNVHYNNAEMLVNELIKHGKLFQFMPYPNRSHSISEGEGTNAHLSKLYTEYLRKNVPPGGKTVKIENK